MIENYCTKCITNMRGMELLGFGALAYLLSARPMDGGDVHGRIRVRDTTHLPNEKLKILIVLRNMHPQ
jgi:hypothetical protein